MRSPCFEPTVKSEVCIYEEDPFEWDYCNGCPAKGAVRIDSSTHKNGIVKILETKEILDE